MSKVLNVVRGLGGVASVRSIEERGCSRWSIRAAIKSGVIGQIRYGWVRTPDASEELAGAVLRGGRLTCASAARAMGLWTVDDRLHMAAPRHSGRIWRPDDQVVLHWGGQRWMDRPAPVEAPLHVIERLVQCVPREDAIAAIDGALRGGLIALGDLQSLIGRLPGEFAEVLDLADPASESGLESVMRVRLRRMRLQVRTQVPVGDVARVDILVGDRLVVELDGKEFHEGRFREDRARDAELLRRGYIVLRLGYVHVMHEWPFVRSTIRSLVQQRAHRRRTIAEVDTRYSARLARE